MNSREWIKSWGMGILLAALLLWGTTLHAAVPAAWKDSGFSINANGMTLNGVLEDFSRTYGVRLSMSGEGDRLVKGRLKADNGIEFLNRLGATYKFRWFVYNNTLYVASASDNTSERLEVGEDAVQDAKAALVGLGLYDERFGWGELPDEGVVIVSGPRSYVDLARNVLLPASDKKVPRKGRQIMMFRLKYATAMDRVITSRGKTETIPGIKTILSNLLFGPNSGEKLSGSTPRFDAASNKRSRQPKNERAAIGESTGEGLGPLFSAPVGNGNNLMMPGGAMDGGRNGGGAGDSGRASEEEGRPRIEADPSLNAIMIYDNINKRDMYASLIAELDVQPQQIEIEALIVDIDRSKLSDMGVEWGVRAGAVNSTINATTAASEGMNLPLPGATLLISNAARFYARLKAMESNGDAHVLATPTVLTLDNVAAVLDLSRSAYVSLVGERVADLADITAGTKLRVIPRIIHDGGQTRVRLEVDIEDGSLDSNDSGNSGNPNNTVSTSVTRSTISTQAIIDSQQTLMIGGYRAEALSKNKQKVPVLGDLPVLGGLFRSESQSTSTKERLFLITPRITGTDGLDVSTTRALREKSPDQSAAPAIPATPATPAAPGTMPGAPAAPMPPLPPGIPGTTTGPVLPVGPPPHAAGPSDTTEASATPATAAATTASDTPAAPVSTAAAAGPFSPIGNGLRLPTRTRVRCKRPAGVGMM
ncbi:type III secretion system outer membrane ring subunit SctC [Herbaspirillum huttiense]|uniref:Type 3 secretion system secretin n=2 Tax=Herbaspirillum huttiense TaxID=863372 RepID=A0AAJ2HHS3_9BURK|nr:type III secretion system outer membrane ring subunit SctC [Herbaspirillum huttiense]MDR9838860.1 type III secretion system outer membrane ring subunit SctC [Herbaspirillum huttiense]